MTSISELKWEETDMFAVEQGFHSYMDRLMTEVLDGFPENGPTTTLSGFPFCGCDTCVVRESMAYLVPKVIDMYDKGLIEKVIAGTSQESTSDGSADY